MKNRTLWIIGIATAVVTVIGLNVAVGSRYRMQDRYHHWCNRDKDKEMKSTVPADSKTDTTNWR